MIEIEREFYPDTFKERLKRIEEDSIKDKKCEYWKGQGISSCALNPTTGNLRL